MFGLGMQELVVILVIALLLFGAEKLPEIGRALGKTMAEMKKGMDGLLDNSDKAKKEEDKTDV